MTDRPAPALPVADEATAARLDRMRGREKVLEVKSLGKTFESSQGPVEALRDVSFSVHRREFLCIVGASGCGKSTLVRLLAGLEESTSGEILVDGRPVDGPGRDRGMVFQGYTLFPWLTVVRNVAFGLEMSGMGRGAADSEAREWIDLVGLRGFEDNYPHQLSGGMKQRVAIARSLAARPRVLLMDEPFGALDAQTRAQMQSHLLQIWKNVDITIVFITHDLDEAVYLSDRILVLDPRPGRVREHLEVPVPRPRSFEQIVSSAFQGTRARLDHLIHPPQPVHDIERIPMVRFTVVGDEVE
ncbi:MAG: ABC transporter ATP-binding protein [Fibrobacteria bacterium]|nr:ABC transporter ATP-binding protein [Fibrobacteria bacterium]